MIMRLLRLFLFFFLFLSLAIAGVLLSPWKNWVATRLEIILANQGFENPHVTIDYITPDVIALRDMTIGTEDPLTLKSLDIYYAPTELLEGHFQNMILRDLSFAVVQVETGEWSVRGVKTTEATQEEPTASPIPMSREAINALPFGKLQIEDSILSLIAQGWNADIPFSLIWDNGLTLNAQNLHVKQGKMDINSTRAHIEAHINEADTGWSGAWHIEGVSVLEIPTLDASGTMELSAEGLKISGKIKAQGEIGIKADFLLSSSFSKPEDTVLMIKSASMPWGQGVVSIRDVKVPLLGKAAITFPVRADKVSVDDVMQMMTGQYVRATGTISGMVPVVIGRDGGISLKNGTLKADHDGTLSMPPDLIPGQGAQIDMTRDVLKNFQYNGLSLEVKNEGKNRLSVMVALKGNNPEMYDGRAVHLNVNLNGDLLDLIRNNVMVLLQPEMLLKQE